MRNLWRTSDVALDVGTANTRLYAAGQSGLTERPSLVPTPTVLGQKQELRDVFSAHVVTPLRGGVVNDTLATAALLRPLLERARRWLGIFRPRVLACTPTDATVSERAALIEATRLAGAHEVNVVLEPLAAAIGAGLDISLPYAQMLVDIGEGVTDIAVLREGKILKTAALRIACSDLRRALQTALACDEGLWLPWKDAERAVNRLGACTFENNPNQLLLTGMDLGSQTPVTRTVSCDELVPALRPNLDAIVAFIRQTFLELDPQVGCEVIENGICLTGGGAFLPGLPQLVSRETGIAVHVARDPLHSVIHGARTIVDQNIQMDFWNH